MNITFIPEYNCIHTCVKREYVIMKIVISSFNMTNLTCSTFLSERYLYSFITLYSALCIVALCFINIVIIKIRDQCFCQY